MILRSGPAGHWSRSKEVLLKVNEVNEETLSCVGNDIMFVLLPIVRVPGSGYRLGIPKRPRPSRSDPRNGDLLTCNLTDLESTLDQIVHETPSLL